MEPVTIVNIVLLVILAIAAIVGFSKGLIRQVLALVGLVASFFIAILLAGGLANVLSTHTGLPYSPSLVVAFIVIFIGGMIGFHFVAVILQKLVHMVFLGWVDRLCGAALGLIVGMMVASLAVIVCLELPVSGDVRRSVEDSEVGMFVRPVAPKIFNMVFSHGEHGIDFESIFKRGGAI